MKFHPTPYLDKLDPITGALGAPTDSYQRFLSNMAEMYENQEAVQKILDSGDRVLYEVHEHRMPELAGELQWCMSITMPGKIGREYHMTKGHFHQVRDTAEIYLCMRGTGFMLMETENGQTDEKVMTPNGVLYVPAGWAHRTVNTGNEPLISFCVYPGDAGHDYGSIETRGFKKRIVEINGNPTIIANKP